MANSVTFDIRAIISGYESSLAELKNRLSHLDVGKGLGKQLSDEFKVASKEYESLMSKATGQISSSHQLDNLFSRVETLGNMLKEMEAMTQSLTLDNLDLSKLGKEFSDLQSKIKNSELSYDSKLNEGIISAVKDSEKLAEVLKSLGVDMSKVTDNADFGKVLSSGIKEAQKELSKLNKDLKSKDSTIARKEALRESLTNNKYNSLETNESLKNELAGKMKVISDFQNEVETNLAKFFESNNNAEGFDKGIVERLFKGMDSSNVKERLTAFYNEINAAFKGQTINRTDVWKNIFGLDEQKKLLKMKFKIFVLNYLIVS